MRPLLLALLCLSLPACGTVPKAATVFVAKREAVLPAADTRTRCLQPTPATIGELLQSNADRIGCFLDQIDRQQMWYSDTMSHQMP